MSARDLSYGARGEEKALPALRKVFGDDLAPNPYKYAPFDYSTSDGLTHVELKTRRNARTAWATTVVGVSKIRHAEAEIRRAKNLKKPVPRFYFAFQFSDGLFYVQHPFPHTVRYLKRSDRASGADHAYFSVALLRDAAVADVGSDSDAGTSDTARVYSDDAAGDDAWLEDVMASFGGVKVSPA